jgi:AP-3 complex subunit delta-1
VGATPGEGVAIVEQFAVALSEEVQPVSLKAQRKVEPPASLLITAPLSERWDDLLVSSGDEDSDDESSRRGKGAKKKKSKHKDVTDLFAQKKSKEQIAREEQEAREMLARHREKMGNYYLGGEVAKPDPEDGGKKKKKGKKGVPEALPAPPPPEPEMPAYMKASMAGVKMARPAIKGESDSESDEETAAPAVGAAKKALYAPKNSSAALHAGLGGYDPLKPLSRGEEMPSVEAYPQYDPYANEGGAANNAFSVPQGDRRRKDKKPSRDKKAAGKDKKASKAKKEEKGGDEKKTKKEKKAEKPAKEKAAKAEKPTKEKKKAKGEKKLSSKMAAVSM